MQTTYALKTQRFMEKYLEMFSKLEKKVQKHSYLFENPVYLGDKKRISPLLVLRLDLIFDEFGRIKIGENDTVSGGKGPSIAYLNKEEQKKALEPYYKWYKSSGFTKFLYCVEPGAKKDENSPYLKEAQFYAKKLREYFNLDIEAHVVTRGSLDAYDPKNTMIDRLFYPYELIKGGVKDLEKFVVTVSSTFIESKRLFAYVHDMKNPLNLTQKELSYFRSVYPYSLELDSIMKRYGDVSNLETLVKENELILNNFQKRLKELTTPLARKSLDNLIEEKKSAIAELEKKIMEIMQSEDRHLSGKLNKKFINKLKKEESDKLMLETCGYTVKTSQKISRIKAEIDDVKCVISDLELKIKAEKEMYEIRKSMWKALPEDNLNSTEGILSYLEKYYPNYKRIESILFSNKYLIKNTDTEGPNMWGARGVIVLREHSLKTALKYLEYKLHPGIAGTLGLNPIVQKIHESRDFKDLWNGVIDGKYLRIPNGEFNFISQELTCTKQYVFARIGMFGLINTDTGETFVPEMGMYTLVRGTVRAHGTPLSMSGPVRFI